ncbi:MAG: hypothetical protein Q8Q94_00920 [bacterium]|nr:hypothetical protein [bacterium]
MARFFSSSNNGVTAVISEEHANRYALVKRAGGDPIAAGCRVFTFCSKDSMERNFSQKMIFSGNYENLRCLVETGKHLILESSRSGWDGYVPFSNGHQWGYQLGSNDQPYQLKELRFVTTLQDLREVFGIGIN